MARKSKSRLDSATMFPIIESYEESGMTQKQFCEENVLFVHTFHYWLSKYRSEYEYDTKEDLSSTPKFQELDIAPSPIAQDSSPMIRVTYPDGTLVELPIR